MVYFGSMHLHIMFAGDKATYLTCDWIFMNSIDVVSKMDLFLKHLITFVTSKFFMISMNMKIEIPLCIECLITFGTFIFFSCFIVDFRFFRAICDTLKPSFLLGFSMAPFGMLHPMSITTFYRKIP